MECMSQPMTNNEVEEFVLECARASTHTSKDIIQSIREMTGDKLDFNHLNVENQKDHNAAYLVSKHQPVQTERDTTNYS